MIPKIVHYCWLSGDKYPEKIEYCINTWRKYLSDYEFWLWDLNRFDIESSIWCSEAFKEKKYAFAADYIRCFALYNYGGIYLDSDVEVVKPFDDLLSLPYFIGKEKCTNLEPAIMGSEKGWELMNRMLSYYSDRHFIKPDGSFDMKPMPLIINEIAQDFLSYKLISNINDFSFDTSVLSVFNADFFSPKISHVPEVNVTKDTYSVHHFEASWFPVEKKLFRIITKVFGYNNAKIISRIYKLLKR